MFLTETEWQTYLRRRPVRYVRVKLLGKEKKCEICGKPDSEENPVQAAHRIPFSKGVEKFAFTPDWLDRKENLGWACRRKCNQKMEWSDKKTLNFLKISGHHPPRFLDV